MNWLLEMLVGELNSETVIYSTLMFLPSNHFMFFILSSPLNISAKQKIGKRECICVYYEF